MAYITCMCKNHLHLVSFLFEPALYYTFHEFFHLLVFLRFVLSDVIVEDTVGLCTCTCTYEKAMVYCSIVFCCDMYEEYCLPTNCDNVVSCIKTLSLCRVLCVSVPPILSYISLHEYPYYFQLCCNNCGVLSKKKLWGCCCAKLIAIQSFMC